MMKQMLKFPGGKWRISEWIISFFPEHKVYLEPFFGSGGVFFNKEPSYLETINDLDGDIVNLFRVCREHPEELAKLLYFTPFAREEFNDCYDISGNSVERARKTIVRYHQSFGTSNSSRNSWKNTQKSGGPRCATMWNYLPDTVFEVCERLKNAQIENTDAITLIERYNHPETLIYLDPPYLQNLRKKDLYNFDLDGQGHIKLLAAIKDSKSKIIISGYDSFLYESILRDWRSAEKETTAQFGKRRTEKIWMNF